MITAKFGGTAITPENLCFVKQALTPAHRAVVVSAVGKEYDGDVKVTDLLSRYYETGSDAYWQSVESKYKRLIERNCVDIDVSSLLADAKKRALSSSREYCLSLGEELSARVVAKYLDAVYVEAQDNVVFQDYGVDFAETYSRLKNAFAGEKRGVMGGFYGGYKDGRRTFSRGGSDISGSIVAVATGSVMYENWTDVYGVCAANPRLVANVKTLFTMSYAEMEALSMGGAEVLHPDAVEPCRLVGVPIRICNFFNKFGASTLVCNCPSRNKLLSIAEKSCNGVYTTTVLHNYPLWEISGIIGSFLKSNTRVKSIGGVMLQMQDIPVYSVDCREKKATLTSGGSIVRKLYKCFS